MPKKAFLICSVRDADDNTKHTQQQIVEDLERQGWHVHWPPRDTNQVDPDGGINICRENRQAIADADCVFIHFNPNSIGSHFDMGMTFAFALEHGKKLCILNREEVEAVAAENLAGTGGKSFACMLLKWEAQQTPEGTV